MDAATDALVVHATTIQAALFGLVVVGTWWLENEVLGGGGGRKRRRSLVNGLFVLPGLPIQVGMAALCAKLALWSTTAELGLLYWLPLHDSPWVKYGAMFLLLDFLDWVYHYAMHHVPVLWRFHLVHHTDQAIDVSTTVREHPGETVARNGFLMLWVVLTGASLELLVLRQTIETLANVLAHTTFRLTGQWARVIGWIVVTPNIHHVHHHRSRPYTDSNYGDVFSVWDRLLGTFAELPREQLAFGLDTHDGANDADFVTVLAMPFETEDAFPIAGTAASRASGFDAAGPRRNRYARPACGRVAAATCKAYTPDIPVPSRLCR